MVSKGGEVKKRFGFYFSKSTGVAVAIAGLYAGQYCTPDRYTCQHPGCYFFPYRLPLGLPNQQARSWDVYETFLAETEPKACESETRLRPRCYKAPRCCRDIW